MNPLNVETFKVDLRIDFSQFEKDLQRVQADLMKFRTQMQKAFSAPMGGGMGGGGFSGGGLGNLAQIGFSLTGITLGFQAAAAAGQAFYGPLIESNNKLNQLIIQTKSLIISTSRVFKDNIQLDTVQALQALDRPVRDAISELENRSLKLAGVTSQQLQEVFGLIAGQIGSVNGSMKDAVDLTVSFASGLGTLGIPLRQANEEVRSILQGTITYNSRLAKALNLTNEQVNAWKQQGTLIENVTRRLQPLVAGQAEVARTLPGVFSNLQEFFERFTRSVGKPIEQELVKAFTKVQDLLFDDKGPTAFAKNLIDSSTRAFEFIVEQIKKIGAPLIGVAQEMGRLIGNIFGSGGTGNMIASAIDAITTAVANVWNFIRSIYASLADNKALIEAIQTYINSVFMLFSEMFSLVGKVFTKAGEWLGVTKETKVEVGGIADFMKGILGYVTSLVNFLRIIIEIISRIGKAVSTIFESIGDNIVALIQLITTRDIGAFIQGRINRFNQNLKIAGNLLAPFDLSTKNGPLGRTGTPPSGPSASAPPATSSDLSNVTIKPNIEESENLKKALQAINKSVNDFLRSLTERIEDLKIDIEELAGQITGAQRKRELSEAMRTLGDNFITSFLEGLEKTFDLIDQAFLEPLQMQRKILQSQREIANLQRNMQSSILEPYAQAKKDFPTDRFSWPGGAPPAAPGTGLPAVNPANLLRVPSIPIPLGRGVTGTLPPPPPIGNVMPPTAVPMGNGAFTPPSGLRGLLGIQNSLLQDAPGAFNPQTPEGRARLAIALGIAGTESTDWLRGALHPSQIYSAMGGALKNGKPNMRGPFQFNMDYWSRQASTQQGQNQFLGQILSGQAKTPDSKQQRDFGADLVGLLNSGAISNPQQLEQWMSRTLGYAGGGRNWQGLSDGWGRTGGLANSLFAFLTQGGAPRAAGAPMPPRTPGQIPAATLGNYLPNFAGATPAAPQAGTTSGFWSPNMVNGVDLNRGASDPSAGMEQAKQQMEEVKQLINGPYSEAIESLSTVRTQTALNEAARNTNQVITALRNNIRDLGRQSTALSESYEKLVGDTTGRGMSYQEEALRGINVQYREMRQNLEDTKQNQTALIDAARKGIELYLARIADLQKRIAAAPESPRLLIELRNAQAGLTSLQQALPSLNSALESTSRILEDMPLQEQAAAMKAFADASRQAEKDLLGLQQSTAQVTGDVLGGWATASKLKILELQELQENLLRRFSDNPEAQSQIIQNIGQQMQYARAEGSLFGQVILGLKDPINGLFTGLTSMLGSVKSFGDLLQGLGQVAVNFLTTVANQFAQMAAQMLANAAINRLLKMVGGGLGGGGGSLGLLGGGGGFGFLSGLGGLLGGFGGSVGFGGGIFNLGATLPLIPAFAAGGVVDRPTLGLIGEAGTEAVVPLSGGRNIPVKLSGGLRGDVTNNVPISISIDNSGGAQVSAMDAGNMGRRLREAVLEVLLDEQRNGGINRGR